jgi:hypothetical protein
MPRKSKALNTDKDVLTSVKKKEKRDYFLLAMPWKSASLKMKIANKVVALLARQPLLREREIIEKLINEDPEIKQYYQQSNSVSIIRYVIWTLANRRVIYKAKILGDEKHVYYFLPEQLEQLKSSVLLYPSDFNPSVLKYYTSSTSNNVSTSSSTSTNRGEELEEEEDWEEDEEDLDEDEGEITEEEDEWLEECSKSGEDC